MSYEFKPARRIAETVLLGLVGPSGSGKTLSALLLASGMCSPRARIAFVDTEGHNGRALQYAPPGPNTFDFDHMKLTPPYTAARYMEAFKLAEKHAGEGGVVIIDSMSSEHEGEGGALEEHHRRSEGKDSKNMLSWAHIRPPQHALCRTITNSRCHVIVCFRAEDKIRVMKVTENSVEKTKPVPIGWQAIGWKRWPYELLISVLLSHDRKGVPIVDGFDWGKIPINCVGLIPTDRPLTVEVGKRLATWAAGGERPTPATSQPTATAVEEGQHDAVASAPTSPNGTGGYKERGMAIAAAMKSAPSLDALKALYQRKSAEIAAMPAEAYRDRLVEVYDEELRRHGAPEELPPKDDPMSELDDIEGLPPEGEAPRAKGELL